MKYLLDFVIFYAVFLVFYLLYYKFFKKEYSKLKDTDYIKIFIARYNLDVRKTKYKTILKVMAFDNALILSIVSTLVLYIKGYALKILISFVFLFVLIYCVYEITGKYLKKKEGK